jgi:hypothetical protein
MLVKASELRLLDVINISDGRRLGNVIDMEIDLDTGRSKPSSSPARDGFSGSSIGGLMWPFRGLPS